MPLAVEQGRDRAGCLRKAPSPTVAVSFSLWRWVVAVNVPPQLSSLGRMNTLASWGKQLARALLHEPLPRRWAHVQGVAARARGLAPVLGADADLIEAAACCTMSATAPALPSPACTNSMAPRYLRDAQHAGPMLCRLVSLPNRRDWDWRSPARSLAHRTCGSGSVPDATAGPAAPV